MRLSVVHNEDAANEIQKELDKLKTLNSKVCDIMKE